MDQEKPLRPNLEKNSEARILSIKCNGSERAQDFFRNSYAPLRVTSSSNDTVDFETLAFHCGGVGFSTSTSRSGLQVVFDEPFDGYGMSYPSAGSMSVKTGSAGWTNSCFKGGLMMDSIKVDSATFSPQCSWHRINLTSEELHQHLTGMNEKPVHNRLKFEPHFNINDGASSLILGIGQAIFHGLKGDAALLSAPSAVASLKDAVLSLFVEAMPHNYSEELRKRIPLPAPRSVKRAIDFMHANLLNPVKLTDIAKASQTSPRSLQTAFLKFRDATPMEYLRRLRLEGARSDLILGAPGTSVADVAYKWGFSHHGMFSNRYKMIFGESPSMTLRGSTKKMR